MFSRTVKVITPNMETHLSTSLLLQHRVYTDAPENYSNSNFPACTFITLQSVYTVW